MKHIICSIDASIPPSLLAKLEIAYRRLNKNDIDADVCKFILMHFENKGFYPSTESIKHQFPSYEEGSKLTDVSDYVQRLEADLRDRKARSLLLEISGDSIITTERVEQVKSLMSKEVSKEAVSISSFDGASEYKKIKDRPAGMKFGIDILDEEVSGLAYGTLLTLFAYVASCKTTTAVSMAYYNAKELNYNINYISLEVPTRELYYNFLSRHAYELYPDTEITAKRIKKALLTSEEEELLFDEIEPSFKEIGGKIFLSDKADISTPSGELTPESLTESLRHKNDQCDGLDCFILDYVNLCKYFKTSGSYDNPVNALVGFTNELVISFQDKGLIGILLAQANRQGWLRACKRAGKYTLDAIAEFNQLEMSSYYVLSLFLDDALRASGELRAQLLKHRAGDIIQEPFTTLAVPDNFFVGDRVGYAEAYTVDALDEVFL